MRGFPKTIGTKADIENLLAMPEYSAQAREKLRELEAGSHVWVTTAEVEDAAKVVQNESCRVIEMEIEGKVKLVQQELQTDQTSLFVRLDLLDLAEGVEDAK